jgi:hypothetical protein
MKIDAQQQACYCRRINLTCPYASRGDPARSMIEPPEKLTIRPEAAETG